MKGYINGVDWLNIEPMKYWAFPASTPEATRRETVRNAIFSGDYIGALKVDGYYQRVLKDEDGNIFMIARSRNVRGEIVDKHEWLPHLDPWFESLPNGTCFLCECYWPGNEGSKNITSILGCLKEKAIARQKDSPLHLYIFDVMAYDGMNYNNIGYEDRARTLRVIAKTINYKSPYIDWAEFYEGEQLWEKLQNFLASGREGMVIMKKNAIVYNKRTPARVSIKCKKEISQTIDCFFTGKSIPATVEYTGKEIENWQYWKSTITGEKIKGDFYKDYSNGATIMPITKGHYNGWAGSLQIGVYDANGKVVELGWLSGLSDEIKANVNKYAMLPIEITAMEIFRENGVLTLRHAKMLQFRPDLNVNDCTIEKIEG